MVSLTKRKAIKIIESTNREYERFLCNLNRRYHARPESLSPEAAVLAQQYDDVYRCVNSSLWQFYKNTKSGDLKAILDEYLALCRNFNFRTLQSFPKEEFTVSETEDKMPEAIEAALEKLEKYGDEQIQKAARQCREGKRIIEFSNMDERQNGQTYRVNDFYSHYITDRFRENTMENQIRLAVTLAHELKRNAATDSLEAETQEIVLSDTKIIESFAGTYGEEIYKKFPEYEILHYIKKIFGETELKEFADYAFDSTGSYWKVNEAGDLADDGNASRVADSKGSELYLGTKGLQGTLQEWLGMENAYAALMQLAGFEWNGKKWSKNPGKIDHIIIEKAHNEGQLTDDQYNLIQLAAGKKVPDDDKPEKISLFEQLLTDYQNVNRTKTQVQVDMANRAWEWLQIQWKKRFGKNSNIENKTDKYNQLNERYEKVKNVKYSNDVVKTPETNLGTACLKQRPLEEKYGYPYTVPSFGSLCLATSIINLYILDEGLTEENVENFMNNAKGKFIEPDGAVISFEKMSRKLSELSGDEKYFDYVYYNPETKTYSANKKAMSKEDFIRSDYDYGIGAYIHLDEDPNDENVITAHYELIKRVPFTEYNPGISDYKLYEIYPVKKYRK